MSRNSLTEAGATSESLRDSNGIRTHNYSVCKRSQSNWPVWLNGSAFVYELSGCGFESHSCHLDPLRLNLFC